MKELQLNSTNYPCVFLLVSSTDHVSPVTGVTPAVTISKNGGAFASASGTVTEIGNGWYALAGNATDRNTLGSFVLHAVASGADPADSLFTVVPWDPFSLSFGLQYDSSGYAKISTGTGTGQLSLSSGNVTVGSYATGQAPDVLVLDSLASSHNTTNTIGAKINSSGSSLTAAQIATAIWQDTTSGDFTVSNSAGAWLSSINTKSSTAAQIATAIWQDTTSGDFTVSNSAGAWLSSINTQANKLNFSTVNSTTLVQADTKAVAGTTATISDGTAQAVSSSSITLTSPSNDPRTSNNLTNWVVTIVSATTGAGQSVLITAYNQSTQIATVAWPITTPTGTITYNLSQPVVVSNLASNSIDSTVVTQSAADKVWNTTTRAITDKTGFVLDATGLDQIPLTAPSGRPTTFRQAMVMVYRRYFSPIAKATSSTTAGSIRTYADDGATVITTQSYTDDGNGNQTQGGA